MTELDPSDGHAVLINTFIVRPEKAQELVKVLAEATETMRTMAGFVSANLHVSRDRTRVVNYAQWHSDADFKAMLGNQEAQPHMKTAADLAESFEPVVYSLDYSSS